MRWQGDQLPACGARTHLYGLFVLLVGQNHREGVAGAVEHLKLVLRILPGRCASRQFPRRFADQTVQPEGYDWVWLPVLGLRAVVIPVAHT
jgi:hypothetical protein